METKFIGLFKRSLAGLIDLFMIQIIGGLVFGGLLLLKVVEGESLLLPVQVIFALVYFTLFESSLRQATPGKMIMKIKVVNKQMEQLSISNALRRNLGKFLSFFLMGIGFLMIPFTKKKQALHDLLSKTHVVKIENYGEYMKMIREQTSSKIIGFTLTVLIFSFLIASFIASQFAKDVGNFLSLILGGVIWAAITYGIYKLFKATGGDEEYLAKKMFANTLGDFRRQDYKVKQDGDITSSSHPTLQHAINMTKSAKNKCLIYYKGDLVGEWKHGERVH